MAALFVWSGGTLPGPVRVPGGRAAPVPAPERGLVVRPERPIRGGDLLHLTRAASVQFVRPIVVRVIRHLADRPTYDGWAWIEAYELDARGEAVVKREFFVQREGLRWLASPPVPGVRDRLALLSGEAAAAGWVPG